MAKKPENPVPPTGAEIRESGRSGRREPVLCGDLDMRIDVNGQWYYHGSPIGRKELVRLFAGVLRRDDSGEYWLQTPAEKGRIAVEDVPFVAVELNREGSGREQTVTVRTNVDDVVTIDADHPLRIATDPSTGTPIPYVTVRDRIEARLARSVYYEMVALGVEETAESDHIYGIWSGGVFHALSRPEETP